MAGRFHKTMTHFIFYYQERWDLDLASEGSIIVKVYTSNAYIPLADVPVSFFMTNENGKRDLFAFRFTDSSGLTKPLSVPAPDAVQSQSPGNTILPYNSVDIVVTAPGFRSAGANNVQIFAGVETIQEFQLMPEGYGLWQQNKSDTPQPPQDL